MPITLSKNASLWIFKSSFFIKKFHELNLFNMSSTREKFESHDIYFKNGKHFLNP
jgi:hypothetical protein